MQALPFTESKDATVDGAGGATVEIGPGSYQGVSWMVDSVAVMTSSATLEPRGEMFKNGNFIGGTYTASRNGSEQIIRLSAGDILKFVWTGADVGATATFTVSGTKYIPG